MLYRSVEAPHSTRQSCSFPSMAASKSLERIISVMVNWLLSLRRSMLRHGQCIGGVENTNRLGSGILLINYLVLLTSSRSP